MSLDRELFGWTDYATARLAFKVAGLNPRSHALIMNTTGSDTEQALADLERDDPDGYALLMEHLPLKRHRTKARGEGGSNL